MDRVYFHFKDWEDREFGMYETTCFMDEQKMIQDCVQLLNCPSWLWECMTFVTHNWPNSTAQQLTNIHRNRQAWLGQAACCFAHGAPEYITKKAWNLLSDVYQRKANDVADDVIMDWEQKYKAGYFSGKNISGLKCL